MDANSTAGSVTRWLGDLKAGDLAATQPLFNRYFTKLIGLVRARLCSSRASRAMNDEEDVALSAIGSVVEGIGLGRFPRLDDRDDLWRILVAVARRKVVDELRRQRRIKNGGGKLVCEADVVSPDGDELRGLDDLDPTALLYHTILEEPTPELAAIMTEEYTRGLERLNDPLDRKISELKLAGHSNGEIAKLLDCSLRTVTLRLERIRKRWQSLEDK
jgi:DNA-directed RNA polymerase specialized sigma24 family protein